MTRDNIQCTRVTWAAVRVKSPESKQSPGPESLALGPQKCSVLSAEDLGLSISRVGVPGVFECLRPTLDWGQPTAPPSTLNSLHLTAPNRVAVAQHLCD